MSDYIHPVGKVNLEELLKKQEKKQRKEISRLNLILKDYGEALHNCSERINKLEDRLQQRVSRGSQSKKKGPYER